MFWALGWLGGRLLEVNRVVKALRVLIVYRRFIGLEVGLGFLVFLYFWI